MARHGIAGAARKVASIKKRQLVYATLNGKPDSTWEIFKPLRNDSAKYVVHFIGRRTIELCFTSSELMPPNE
jgi:hypothetical protein